jgi:hypothetical protein
VEQPYYQAARYPHKTAAGKAYTPIEQIIHAEACDLSAYRYLVPNDNERKWYVVVLGEQPTPQLHERIKTILTTLTRGGLSPLMTPRCLFCLHDVCSKCSMAPGWRDTIPSRRSRRRAILFPSFVRMS